MGVTSVNLYQNPEYKVNNPWGYNTGAVSGVNPTTEVYTPTVEYTGANLFAGNYSGINENLGVGSQIHYPKQAGVDRTGSTLGFA